MRPRPAGTTRPALFAHSLQQLAARGGEASFAEAGNRIVESYIEADGTIATYQIEDFNIDMVTPGRARDGSFEYYISEPVIDNDLKGVGPFILAGLEMQQLLSADAASSSVVRGWDDQFPRPEQRRLRS